MFGNKQPNSSLKRFDTVAIEAAKHRNIPTTSIIDDDLSNTSYIIALTYNSLQEQLSVKPERIFFDRQISEVRASTASLTTLGSHQLLEHVWNVLRVRLHFHRSSSYSGGLTSVTPSRFALPCEVDEQTKSTVGNTLNYLACFSRLRNRSASVSGYACVDVIPLNVRQPLIHQVSASTEA